MRGSTRLETPAEKVGELTPPPPLHLLQWGERVKNSWATLRGTDGQSAIMDYLNIAQDLEQYGITYFEVTNKKGTRLWLGVHNLGMDVCVTRCSCGAAFALMRCSALLLVPFRFHLTARRRRRYEYHNKVTPRLGFPWGEIRNISFNDKKFTIKMVSKDALDFKFYSPRFKVNKRILALCVGNHQLFVARRRAQVT